MCSIFPTVSILFLMKWSKNTILSLKTGGTNNPQDNPKTMLDFSNW